MNCKHEKIKTVNIVIPCYRSERTIKQVVEGIKAVFSKCRDLKHRIILIDDGSPDNVFSVIREMCVDDPQIIGISLSRNYGQQSARMVALPYVDGDYVIYMDDDGQHPPEGILALIDKLEEGYDVAFARFKEKKHSFFKQIGSRLNATMATILIGKPKEVVSSSFFAMRLFVARELVNYKSSFPYIVGYMLRITTKIANVDIEHKERITGTTTYTFRKMLSIWINGFTSFSVVPLRAASMIGAITAGGGFLFGFYIIFRKIFNPSIPTGYSSIMAAFLFVGGMIMLMLGLLGEYVGRIFLSINNLPQYVVKETINYDKGKV